jgi:hypothetical protein
VRVGKKRILAGFAAAGVAAAAASVLLPAQEPALAQAAAPMHAAQAPADARFAALPAREGLGKALGEPFGSRSWAPRVAAPSQPAVAPPPLPAAPQMPYRIAGQVLQDGHTYVVLVRGDRVVFNVREGQTLEDGYRVESIRADGVTLVYLPLDVREDLAAAPTVLRVGAKGAPSEEVIADEAASSPTRQASF